MAFKQYKLSASLTGHEDDVRAVVFPTADTVASSSRDTTVRLWRRKNEASTLSFDDHINSTGSAFVNSVAVMKPTPEHPNGLVISGGQDTIIEVREPDSDPGKDPQYLLLGHTHNVCALDTFNSVIVSGSWDGTARVWKDWNTIHVLEGHEGAVWGVLAFSETDIATAGADKTIRLWKNGKQISTIRGHTDVVRGLCKVPQGLFASCSNDATIRIWSTDGEELQQLVGHTNYIYSISALPTGEIVSGGEDRTVRIWQDGNCVQTITHPAISVWSVGYCAETGDIATGASDNIVRVFSKDTQRWASEEDLKAFDDSVAGSSIPENQVGDLKNEDISGPEKLQERGTKDGEIALIKNGEGVDAYMWSGPAQNWTKMGAVVGSGSDKKREYEGKKYDFVFDVDIQEGAPPLKLPYNASENPFEAARKFLEKNELPMSYLDTVGNFIVQNSKGASLGAQEETGYMPWGSESRYKPGDELSSKKPKLIPQRGYLSITSTSLAAPEKRIKEVNQDLITQGDKEKSLNPDELASLSKLCRYLEAAATSSRSSSTPSPIELEGLDLAMKLVTVWPMALRIPGLDLLRTLAATSTVVATCPGLIEILQSSGSFDKAHPNHVMLITRGFVNLFLTEPGRKFVATNFETICEAVISAAEGTTNKNLKIAQATLFLNYAVLFYAQKSVEPSVATLDIVIKIISEESEPETVFRALVALGTLVSVGPMVKSAAKNIYKAKETVATAMQKNTDSRIKGATAELAAIL